MASPRSPLGSRLWLAAVLAGCGCGAVPATVAAPPVSAAADDQPHAVAASAGAVPTVAGRDLAGWSADLDSDDRVVRLRAVRSLGLLGADAGDVLGDALQSDDAAVRYLAALHLGRIGGPPLDAAVDRLQPLRDDDRQPAVQMAAAYALCRAGAEAANLRLLTDRLGYPERGMACSAAELLGMLGPAARAAVPALQQTVAEHGDNKGDSHIGSAALQALRKIESAQPQPDDGDPGR